MSIPTTQKNGSLGLWHWQLVCHDPQLSERQPSLNYTPKIPYLKKKCVCDQALMDLVSDRLTRAECHIFNRCQLFLQSMHIRDIASGDCKRLLKASYHGVSRLKSRLNGPEQHHLLARDWSIWRRVLKEELLSSVNLLNLRVSLGPWYNDSSSHHRQWKYYFDPNTHTLYESWFMGWKKYNARMSFYRGFIGEATGVAQSLPSNVTTATIDKNDPYSFHVWISLPFHDWPLNCLEYWDLIRSDALCNHESHTVLCIWNENRLWHWSLHMPHQIFWSAFDSQLTVYQSFLMLVWMVAHQHSVDIIETSSSAHVK